MAPDEHDKWDEIANRLGDVIEPEDVIDVTTMDNTQLLRKFSDVRERLYALDEMVFQTTAEGRELQSLRAAILVELKNRGLR